MRKIIPVAVAGVTALAVAGGAFGYTTMNKDVTLSVEGATTEVSTLSSTVGDVLADQGITVGAHDVVAPAADAKLADGTRIAVQYGRQMKVDVDGTQKTFWTTATDVGSALTALGLDLAGADLSTSRSSSIGREGLSLDIATKKTVTIDNAGKSTKVDTTAQDVAGALKAAKITVDSDDELSVKPSAKLTDGAKFTYTLVDVKTVTKKQDVDHTSVRKDSSSLYEGTSRVDTTGKDGVRTITYKQTLHNGDVKTTTKTKSEITTAPRTEVVLVGTKKKPEPKPLPKPEPKPAPKVEDNSSSRSNDSSSSSKSNDSSSSSKSNDSSSSSKSNDSSSSSKSNNSSKSSSPSVASGSVWDKLAQCEAGGNWAINTGNGFYGGLQFTLSTWKAYGGSGMPNQASREAQIAVGKKVQAGQGWGAWPACTSKLGIR